MLNEFKSIEMIEAGYARLDHYYSDDIKRLTLPLTMRIDPTRRLFCGYLRGKILCSIDVYKDMFITLSTKYNIILKYHPYIKEPRLIDFRNTSIIIEEGENLDNTHLFI